MSSRKNLILIQMGNVVPRSALGYVADLGSATVSEKIIEDRLKLLARHCPELVEEFRSSTKIGRPSKPAEEKYETPARQLGRVNDSDWNEIKEAAEAAGESLVNWALPTLLKKARREKSKRSDQ